MLKCFNDVNCTMNWAKCNVAKITKIRSMRIELWCFERLYELNSMKFCDQLRYSTLFRTFVLRAQYRNKFTKLSLSKLQRSMTQCATIEFLLFLHHWISFNSYYNWCHVSIATNVITNYWAADVAIALAKFEIRRLSRRALYR